MPKSRPPQTAWETALENSADPARASHYSTQLAPLLTPDYFKRLAPEQAQVLAGLFSGSRALSELLLRKPEWISIIEIEHLRHPRRKQGLIREVNAVLEPALQNRDNAGALARLRDFKQRDMLRIAARDLARLATLPEIVEEISNIADVCINAVCEISLRESVEKFGKPYAYEPAAVSWTRSAFCVLGMGKLGGQELNYSSDIDVLFVYSAEGELFKTPPTKSTRPQHRMSSQQFYTRVAENIIAECTRMTGEGFLFRIDMRLRPEGKTAPLARSLAGYENYYAQWGQTWERMMLIKARCVAGDEGLGAEFLEMVQPFRYPRSISEQIPHEVAQMKQRTENEIVRSGELERNVKLGRGGIREIEFLVQTQQVLQAGRHPFLQGSKTLPALDKLRDYNLIEATRAGQLKQAYCFLRDVEHRLQMEDNRQTHTIPVSKEARTRLARLMGFATLAQFEKQLQVYNDAVRAAYDRFIKQDEGEAALPAEVEVNSERWLQILKAHSFRDPQRCLKLVQEFVTGPGFGHRSSRTIDLALQLLDRLLEMCPSVVSTGRTGARPLPPGRLARWNDPAEKAPLRSLNRQSAVRRDAGRDNRGGRPTHFSTESLLSDPDRVLARLDSFVAKYGARSMLYEAWTSNPSLFRLLLLAFDRSEFLAELAIRVPDLIDEIEQSGQLRRRKTTEQILEDLRQGHGDANQFQWLRRYFQAEQMRIGLRDILDLANPEQTQVEITALADAYLIYALEVVTKKRRLKKAPFAIFGLGKLGGRELIYASDLDIIFVAEDKTADLPGLQKLAIELMDLLSKRTEDGTTFATDARLRPDGEKGLLVNTLSGYKDYYEKRAMLWEVQSLSRFRPITGNESVVRRFSATAEKLVNFSRPRKDLAAYAPDWKEQIHKMRLRIEKERTPPGKDHLAIKTGLGGLMDVEFIAQTLCLENGWREPNTLAAIARAAEGKILKTRSAETLAINYRRLMQIERILRRWSFEAESVLPSDLAPFYRVAIRCGFVKPEHFQTAVNEYRAEIRAEYSAFFNSRAHP
ncbi:MAG TPA: hypothetical protein VGR78_02055 [Verrucomicrobiae bacterium]|nr:hypothetical protein [Verrucomicrobiae bacterium]